jgi:hypothetical protein
MSREFWIDPELDKSAEDILFGYALRENQKQSNHQHMMIHAIEYSAFEKSQAQLARALDALEKLAPSERTIHLAKDPNNPLDYYEGVALKALADIKAMGGGDE